MRLSWRLSWGHTYCRTELLTENWKGKACKEWSDRRWQVVLYCVVIYAALYLIVKWCVLLYWYVTVWSVKWHPIHRSTLKYLSPFTLPFPLTSSVYTALTRIYHFFLSTSSFFFQSHHFVSATETTDTGSTRSGPYSGWVKLQLQLQVESRRLHCFHPFIWYQYSYWVSNAGVATSLTRLFLRFTLVLPSRLLSLFTSLPPLSFSICYCSSHT